MSDLKGKYPLVLSQQLIWGDMDAFQHINNAVYFRFFEDARIAYLEKAGVMKHKDKTQLGPILASTKCDFRAPLSFPDTIQIATIIVDIQRNRFKMKYLVYSESLNKVAAEGEGMIVYYDYRKQKSCDIPEFVLSSINTLQQKFV